MPILLAFSLQLNFLNVIAAPEAPSSAVENLLPDDLVKDPKSNLDFGKLGVDKSAFDGTAKPNPGLESLGASTGQKKAKETIQSIEIEGNRLVLEEEIIKTISSFEGGDFSKDLVLDDLKSIYDMGYFERDNLEVKPYRTDEGLVLRYVLKENTPITALEVYGNDAISEVNVHKYFADLIGKPENVKILSERIRDLESNYVREGFILARVDDVELEGDGTLKVYINEGIINAIKFTGNKKTKDKYLNHIITNVEIGEAYNEKNFSKDFKKLQGTGYFADVARTLTPTETDGYDLNVNVHEKRTINVGLGGGINTSAGLFGNANLTAGNLRGKGEKLNINGLIGSGFGSNASFENNSRLFRRRRVVQFGGRYTIPYFNDTENTLGLNANFLDGPNFRIDLADQTKINTGFDLTRKFGENGTLRGGVSMNFLTLDEQRFNDYISSIAENISGRAEIDCANSTASEASACRQARDLRRGQLDDGFYISVKPTYNYLGVDNKYRPRKGWKNRVALEPVLSFGDFDSFVKADASVTKYFPLPKQSAFVLNARTGLDLLGSLPQFTQFRLGGRLPIRGYRPFTELGVGEKMFVTTAEVRTPVYNFVPWFKRIKFLRDVDFALFADAGIVGGNTRLNEASQRLNRAIALGAGLRVNLPLVGALRVDLGIPIVEALVNNSRNFRFTFGLADNF